MTLEVSTLLRAEKMATLNFRLPTQLQATEPPEARGLRRDDVRLMVSYRSDDRIVHTHFREISVFLRQGDVLVINTSGTRPAAVPAWRADGERFDLHLSNRLPTGLWLVELRKPAQVATKPYFGAEAGERLTLPEGGAVTLRAPYGEKRRLWVASVRLPATVDEYLQRHGHPIRYDYVTDEWPLSCYETVYATEPGSAEMPSAGRAFTPQIITQLVARGVHVAPLLLHTGVASLEADEPLYEEAYFVPESTARLVNMVRNAAGRVIAVGTTVVRALETVADEAGRVQPDEGWTGLAITPQRGIRVVDGILTGWHEPKASHLALLEALAGKRHLQLAYEQALNAGYLWHEFGDLHLILP